jgi:glucose-1-phosphate thymidylyltransferase
LFEKVLGDGSQWGLKLDDDVQPDPGGPARADLICADWLDDASACVLLGDSLHYGHGITDSVRRARARESGAAVLGC